MAIQNNESEVEGVRSVNESGRNHNEARLCVCGGFSIYIFPSALGIRLIMLLELDFGGRLGVGR